MMNGTTQKIPAKKLNRIRLVNWMYFGDETIPVNKGTVLISGENAAGKSTVLDAVQMLLTGNTTKFNKAANENSDRDLKSYVRCKINTTSKTYTRSGNVISNVALEFYEEKEKRYFVIGVHLSSPDETESVSKRWYIQNGRLEDFSFFAAERKPAMPQEFRNKGLKIPYIGTAREYKTQLAHRLGGLEEKFFDVILKALAFRPVDNVKDFINQYVLAEKNIDIQTLRESIDTLADLERTLKRAVEEKNALSEIMRRFSEIEKNRHDKQVNEALLKIAERSFRQQSLHNYEGQLKASSQRLEDCRIRKESLERQIAVCGDKIIELRQALNGTDFKATLDRLNYEISVLKEKKSEQERLDRQLAKEIKGLKNFLSLMAKNSSVPFSPEDTEMLLQGKGNFTDEEFESAKAEKAAEIEDFARKETEKATREKIELERRENEISDRIAYLERQIAQLEARKITFPKETEELRRIIQQEFESRRIDSHVYLLAELLSITDRQWTNAIEGFLAERRFHLIVEPEHYALAMEIYLSSKKIHGQAIADFTRLPKNLSCKENSLTRYVHSESELAARYADYLLGDVICCQDIYQAQEHFSAITKDCVVYADYAMRKISPEIYCTPYIGKDAIDAQLKNCRTEKASLSAMLPDISQRKNVLIEIENAARRINFGIIMQCLPAPRRLMEISESLSLSEDELARLKKNPDIIELQQQTERQEQNKMQLEQRRDETIKTIARIENEISHPKEGLLIKIQETKNEIAAMVSAEEALRANSAAAYSEASQKYASLLKNRNPQYIKENYKREQSKYDNRDERLLKGGEYGGMQIKGLFQLQAEFASKFLHEDIPQGSDNAAKDAYARRLEKLAGYEIVQYEESVKNAKEKCEDIFKNDFVSKMKESIEQARYEFEGLRRALKDISYGEDTYKFVLTANRNKESLYRMICSDENLGGGSLFSADFENRYKNEISELFDKIKAAGESDSAAREYADYRSYLDYDIEIHKKDGSVQKLSARAKSNSGGESQVPFYVIMAASLNSIYRNSYCARLLLLDEAFSNMDEQRISAVMSFFKALGLQCLLAAPSPKIQDIEEHTDSVLTVIRDGETSFVEDFKYYGE